MKRSKAIIFDLGFVLIDIDWTRAIRHIAPHTTIPPEQIIHRILSDKTLAEYETGKISTDIFLQRLALLLDVSLSPQQLASIWTDIFIRRHAMENLLAETIQQVPVAILSDTNPLHWDSILERVPLFQSVTAKVLSHEVGVRKPHPRIYQTAAKKCNAIPSACLFLDDKQDNVAGAKAIGMHALRFTSVGEARRHISAFLADASPYEKHHEHKRDEVM